MRVSRVLYEATISTIENTPETAARVPEPEFEQERQRNFAESTPGGPETPDAGVNGCPMKAESRFGRAARIKQGRDFARLRGSGQRLAHGCLVANWLSAAAESGTRLGVITSGKLGGAVVRNRARRLLRESFRVNQHRFTRPVDLVLIARSSIVGRSFQEVERDLLTTLRKAGLLKGDRAAGS